MEVLFQDPIWLIIFSVGMLAFIGSTFFYFRKKRTTSRTNRAVEKIDVGKDRQTVFAEEPLPAGAPEPEAPPAAKPDLAVKLSKSRGALFGRLQNLFGGERRALEAKQWEELEEALLEADVGYSTTQRLLAKVKESDFAEEQDLRARLLGACEALLNFPIPPVPSDAKPLVISIVGINGVGKTTTIGKLATRFQDAGQKVLLGAADTFRAGAISQLKVWADRSGAQIVSGREGSDPGAVAFDALTAGQARGVDVVLMDTAGRLHTKSNLMDELKKVHRVMKKVIPEAPHEIWLVIDGTLGQNSIQQAREFSKALEVTGIIITKLDGTAKGGAVMGIASELQLPVRYIGVGEAQEDLIAFEPKAFSRALLST